MRILITGAGGNLGAGMTARLKGAGHDLVLSDIRPLPDDEPFIDIPFVPCDVQVGFGLERAAVGCDLILHLPAWHGIHTSLRSEIDFWRLNVDGTFWMFQAAKEAGVKRVVFISSQAWNDPYGKYGFTKRVGEDLCEYHRRNHGIRYVALRPADFTPWTTFPEYGARLLYGGVDREDVLECITASIEYLAQSGNGNPPGLSVNAVRANAFTDEQLHDWEADPMTASDRIFPGSSEAIARYGLEVARRPAVVDLGKGARTIGWRPSNHFGTFLTELGRLEAEIGESGVLALRCPY
ncbi:MAG: NAD(P)-dependent oxidoreductase [Chloroflexi bacterium]|nr:NAD(P)-dependent oxidoreductase [Chloroflexota bacterium]